MVLALAALAGCSGEAPAPAPEASGTPVAAATAEVSGPEIRGLAFGDSLFAGYGLADPATQSYPARLEAALRGAGRNVRIANAGVSGDTTAAGRQRLAFTLDSQPEQPDFVILELGGNDLLRGLPPEQTRENLSAMLDELKTRGIPVILYGLQAPPNYGAEWQAKYDAIFPDLAKQYGATLVPFVTEEVFADPAMLQADRIHPTDKGVAALVDATAEKVAGALPDKT
ncbi:Arylesterase precursor [Tsuneonella dongtanensis]|uniref:Arylesterase n=1 Tax=Tsuneonella dongtanensis TaxID=692370 RepID=A0A1B2AC76_9SPHN|nr:arylesterase [Tsuneonella dongtanensis]ANY19769.1 Arylesterase precursor [Tsuneonella dongtanensis]